MATLAERIQEIRDKIEEGASDVKHRDVDISYDLDVLRKRLNDLLMEQDAQAATPRTTRTLLTMEVE